MMRHGKNVKEMDRSFDIEFWQRQGERDHRGLTT